MPREGRRPRPGPPYIVNTVPTWYYFTMSKLKDAAARINAEIAYYRALSVHPGTPRVSKWLIALALIYLASPIDFIPDFIPVIGHLDDLLIVPSLIWLALKFIPEEVKKNCRENSWR